MRGLTAKQPTHCAKDLVRSFGMLCENTLELEATFVGLVRPTWTRIVENSPIAAPMIAEGVALHSARTGTICSYHYRGVLRGITRRKGNNDYWLSRSNCRNFGVSRPPVSAYPILLLDDVVSELDQPRTGSVFEWLRSTPSQVFLSTPRPDLLQALEFTSTDQMKFDVSGGQIRALEQ